MSKINVKELNPKPQAQEELDNLEKFHALLEQLTEFSDNLVIVAMLKNDHLVTLFPKFDPMKTFNLAEALVKVSERDSTAAAYLGSFVGTYGGLLPCDQHAKIAQAIEVTHNLMHHDEMPKDADLLGMIKPTAEA